MAYYKVDQMWPRAVALLGETHVELFISKIQSSLGGGRTNIPEKVMDALEAVLGTDNEMSELARTQAAVALIARLLARTGLVTVHEKGILEEISIKGGKLNLPITTNDEEK